MPVHTQENRLKVVAMIFEARYDEGYRLLDNLGNLLIRLKKNKPSWTVSAVGQQLASLQHAQDDLLLNITTLKLDISATKQLTLTDADKKAQSLGRESAEFYQLVLETLNLPRTSRAGTRFSFFAPADSLEEADRFLLKASPSPMLSAVAEITKFEPRESGIFYVLDDSVTGARRRVTLNSVIMEQRAEDPPFMGLPGDVGSGGIIVDIDTYLRPNESHLPKPAVFVQENYLQSRSQAKAIMAWLIRQQK